MGIFYDVPVGDGFKIQVKHNGVNYRLDADRSVPTNEAKDNDAIAYLIRIED